MIRKLFLLFFLLILVPSRVLHAQQACVPDPAYTTNGVHPDSATGFAQGYANQPYSQLVTIKVPQDTTPAFPPVPIVWDSTVLVNITGLPNGFTYACWNNAAPNARCRWKGNTTGCAIITGNPTISDTGTYPLTISTKNYLGGGAYNQPYAITYYKIRINAPLAVANFNVPEFMVNDCFPNPFSERTEISFTSPDAPLVTIRVFNIVGTEVYAVILRAQRGTTRFTFEKNALPPGMYIYSVSNGLQTISKKMVIGK